MMQFRNESPQIKLSNNQIKLTSDLA